MIAKKEWFRKVGPAMLEPVTIQGVLYSGSIILLLIILVSLPFYGFNRYLSVILICCLLGFAIFDINPIMKQKTMDEIDQKRKEKLLLDTSSDIRYCPRCNNQELDTTSIFCSRCGSVLSLTSKTNKISSKEIYIYFLIVFILALSLSIFVFLIMFLT